MASAAQLRKLRKKYHLGEFKPRGNKRRKKRETQRRKRPVKRPPQFPKGYLGYPGMSIAFGYKAPNEDA